MLEPRRIESNITPQKFEDLGNGNWYYNYDIQSKVVEVPKMDGSGKTVNETRWNYIQIKLGSKPEYKKCVEALIRKYITQSQEFDLINSTNRILLSGEADKVAPPEYIEYLNLLDEIKTKVKADFGM